MFLAKHSKSVTRTSKASLCLVASSLALLLSACASSSEDSASTSQANAAQEDRIVYMIPAYSGKSWGDKYEDEYLNALQKTDLVFDEENVQLIHVQNAAPSRIILYKQLNPQNVTEPLPEDGAKQGELDKQENTSDPQASSDESATGQNNEAAKVASLTSSSATSLSLTEVAALAGAQSDSPAPSHASANQSNSDKVVRVSSIRDTKNHWQKSQKPCYNCTNPTEYDPFYYEPFYKKFPTPGVDKK